MDPIEPVISSHRSNKKKKSPTVIGFNLRLRVRVGILLFHQLVEVCPIAIPFLKRLVQTTCMVFLVSFSSLLKVSAQDYADFLKDLGIGD